MNPKSKPAARKAEQPTEVLCLFCGHPESAHGTTGHRPCLAMTGDVLAREFCTCDGFIAGVPKAA